MKKFYKTASAKKGKDGFEVHLDGKPLKTPLKENLSIPTRELARLIAAEWQAQGDIITPDTLPLTRLANTAQDVTLNNFDKVLDEVVAFAAHDLLCYRTGEPKGLHKQEAALWDPYLAWAKNAHGISLQIAHGISPVEQDKAALKKLARRLHGLSPFMLAALHNATTLTGSVILALALAEGFTKADDIWRAAHVDEDFQVAKWGKDVEAENMRSLRRKLFDAVSVFMNALDETPCSG